MSGVDACGWSLRMGSVLPGARVLARNVADQAEVVDGAEAVAVDPSGLAQELRGAPARDLDVDHAHAVVPGLSLHLRRPIAGRLERRDEQRAFTRDKRGELLSERQALFDDDSQVRS